MMLLLLAACDTGFADPSRALGEPVPDGPRHPTEIHRPTTLGVVDTPLADVHGTPIGVACVTCHGPDPATAWASRDGEAFHTGVALKHGTLTCASCHDPEERTQLRLANATQLELPDAMTLCAQCHGPQFRDYTRGSHGGMTGYWDTRRGPRERNNCVDCHAAHAPAYAKVLPVFPPADRRPLEHADAPATSSVDAPAAPSIDAAPAAHQD
ncbi:MAG: cytochrome c3 family protein [Pseudomonadota bacterium]|nr:cytochrome c3 family protein [Pseudomonadota bacterium]